MIIADEYFIFEKKKYQSTIINNVFKLSFVLKDIVS